MRYSLAFVLVLAACGSASSSDDDDTAPPNDSAGGDGTVGDGGPDGTTAACAGLDMHDCRSTPGCVADSCVLCTCTPEYQGCRRAAEAPLDCPAVGCDPPFTCCADQDDCDTAGAGICFGPGVSPGCGACFPDPGNCTSDNECGDGQICQPIACSCEGASQCVAGCTGTTTCPTGTTCSADAHPRCMPSRCDDAAPCPTNFSCVKGGCRPTPCTDDSDCLDGYCTLGSCQDSLGQCAFPPP